jgi:hypothetical protein
MCPDTEDNENDHDDDKVVDAQVARSEDDS